MQVETDRLVLLNGINSGLLDCIWHIGTLVPDTHKLQQMFVSCTSHQVFRNANKAADCIPKKVLIGSLSLHWNPFNQPGLESILSFDLMFNKILSLSNNKKMDIFRVVIIKTILHGHQYFIKQNSCY